jgi:uncharacterized protein
MSDLLVGLALVLVIEGVLWAGFPQAMKRAAAQAQTVSEARLRVLGLGAALIGLGLVWLARG